MRSNQTIGFSLIAQAHFGLVIFSILLAVSLLFSINTEAIVYGLGFGVLTGSVLLAYWHGKGGTYFVCAFLCPLICIIMTPLNSFMAIANLIGAFFVGLCLLLTMYKLKKGS